jgi:hypothetical protein
MNRFCSLHSITCSILILALALSGCAGLQGRSAQGVTQEARLVLAALDDVNATLETVKGIGALQIRQQGMIPFNERLAWIGSQPDKLSMTLLVSGYPAAKIAYAGQWLYYLAVNNQQTVYQKVPSASANLQKILSISIDTEDILDLLCGRVPLRNFSSAELLQQPENAGAVLVLQKQWSGAAEKIYLDDQKAAVRQIEIFDRSGTLVYRAVFEKMQQIDRYRVPQQLKITNDAGSELRLRIDRYWVDVSVSDAMFELSPPD